MQLTYSQVPDAFYEGQPVDDGPKDDASTLVEEAAGIDPGLLVFRGTDRERQAQLPPAVAADPDGIVASFTTSTGVQTLTAGSGLNGVIGAERISPPSLIDFVLNSHADWDATNLTLVGLDENGLPVTELVAIPNGGNATITSANHYSFVQSVSVPPQSGTGGTMTGGVQAAAGRTLDGEDVIGVSVRTHKARTSLVAADCETYEDEERMPVRKMGRVAVLCETAFTAGQRPLARVVAAGAERLGAFRAGSTDGGDCIPWNRARFVSSGGAGEIGVLEIAHP